MCTGAWRIMPISLNFIHSEAKQIIHQHFFWVAFIKKCVIQFVRIAKYRNIPLGFFLHVR